MRYFGTRPLRAVDLSRIESRGKGDVEIVEIKASSVEEAKEIARRNGATYCYCVAEDSDCRRKPETKLDPVTYWANRATRAEREIRLLRRERRDRETEALAL